MFHANGINLEKYDYKLILGNMLKVNPSEPSDWSPDFRTTMKIATKTPRHQSLKKKIPLCRCAFVAIIFIRLRARLAS